MITKTPKHIKLKIEEYQVTCYKTEYDCPSCGVKYIGTISPKGNIIKFTCDCGQELIIDK